MTEEKKRGKGRPAYEYNERDAGKIEALAHIGVGQRFIALYIGKDRKTISKYYDAELHQPEMSMEERKITMANALFYQGAFLNIPASTIYWLKCNYPEIYADKQGTDITKEDLLAAIAGKLPD